MSSVYDEFKRGDRIGILLKVRDKWEYGITDEAKKIFVAPKERFLSDVEFAEKQGILDSVELYYSEKTGEISVRLKDPFIYGGDKEELGIIFIERRIDNDLETFEELYEKHGLKKNDRALIYNIILTDFSLYDE
ncbi:MAG: hypothetical protein DRP73_03725 [Candidatus Omnitrophota bacterium]|nr:MAG: hypothetical protein DRP73_03725 [Candidatus Omnitrophota bacterium]